VVWQDQSDGSLEVYARNTVAVGATTRQLTHGDFSQKNPKTDGHYAVWQGRASDGSWDIYMADLDNAGAVVQVTDSLGVDEINPCIDWPWVVYQTRAASRPSDPWQLKVKNLLTGAAEGAVWSGPLDQLDPDIEGGRVVWQDWRDVGPGEIYFKDLETGVQRRITINTFGQYHPVIAGRWIVWQDNRDSQVDIFGFDLLRNREVQITDTPENEANPFIDGEWICCLEDSQGTGLSNIRLVHLASRATMPLTRDAGVKKFASVNGRQLVWMEQDGTSNSVVFAELPALQAVFQTMNAVPVTQTMVDRAGDAFTLLELWNDAVGVQAISRYSSVVPTLTKQTASWNVDSATGDNFALTAGDFIWLGFDAPYVADTGDGAAGTLSLSSGVNVFGYTGFPQPYSAHEMVRQLGLDKVRAIRMLDTATGVWAAAEVRNGALIGRDFKIPASAVIWVDMKQAVNDWRPL
jgi:beta propeller repeat protein